jgi:hypothetical protein
MRGPYQWLKKRFKAVSEKLGREQFVCIGERLDGYLYLGLYGGPEVLSSNSLQ